MIFMNAKDLEKQFTYRALLNEYVNVNKKLLNLGNEKMVNIG